MFTSFFSIILEFIGYAIYWIPRKIQMNLGSFLGWILYQLHFRLTIVQNNLQFAFPGDVQKKKEITDASYQHLGRLILEIFMLFGPMQKFILRFVDYKGNEHIEAANSQGRGIIFLSSHLGNWEIMAAAGGLLTSVDVMVVTKRLRPRWFHIAVEKARLRCHVQATYEPKTLRDIFSHLKKLLFLVFFLFHKKKHHQENILCHVYLLCCSSTL